MRQELREYQQRGLAQILDAFKRGARRVLAISPTGSGKTTIFSHLAADLRFPVLINVHRYELADQARNRLREFEVRFGMIMAGERADPAARIQIASVQTLVRRPHSKPPANLVICDEAHLSTANTWSTILNWYPNARVLGFTATPWRLGGKPLVGAYDETVVVATPNELREQGHLCDYVGFSYKSPDLEGIDQTGEDFDAQKSAAAMSALAGDIVEQWLAHARHLSTVVFACTVEHSQGLAAQFRAAGVTAEHIDGNTPHAVRKSILARVSSGETRVLCNVGIAIEGLDIPRLKCCVLARPTMSLARAIQMMGRVRRPWRNAEGRWETARIHDHAFVIGDGKRGHGLPDQDRDYSLHSKKEKPPSLTRCPKCFATYDGARACPGCGAEREIKPREERVVQTIEDAEQFGFSSEDAAALAAIDTAVLPEAWKPPVKVRWDTIGREIEGVYEGAKEDNGGQFGPQVIHLVRGANRTYALPGLKDLNARLRGVKVDDRIIVKFVGATELGDGRARKHFEVAVDDGS